ncbi:hypothetical protein PV325_013762, partial [Microctonus aethiopoides]
DLVELWPVKPRGCRVEAPTNKSLCKDGAKARQSVLRTLVRKLSSGSGSSLSGRREEIKLSRSVTVSGSGCSSGSGRGSLSRRTSRDPSPTNNLNNVIGSNVNQHDTAATSFDNTNATCSSQDWRRLVGSIRRKVRRKTPNNNINTAEQNHHHHHHHRDGMKNDDFLKATMGIFLV